MSHLINVSIPDCQNLVAIKERLEQDEDEAITDDAQLESWIATLSSIIVQAVEDGF